MNVRGREELERVEREQITEARVGDDDVGLDVARHRDELAAMRDGVNLVALVAQQIRDDAAEVVVLVGEDDPHVQASSYPCDRSGAMWQNAKRHPMGFGAVVAR